MIERLARSIRALSALAPDELTSPAGADARANCADALRLELDCMQQSLSTHERAILTRLSDELEAGAIDRRGLAESLREARTLLDGIA